MDFDLILIRFCFDLILIWLDFDLILIGFGWIWAWIWLGFCWIRLGFGLISTGFRLDLASGFQSLGFWLDFIGFGCTSAWISHIRLLFPVILRQSSLSMGSRSSLGGPGLGVAAS